MQARPGAVGAQEPSDGYGRSWGVYFIDTEGKKSALHASHDPLLVERYMRQGSLVLAVGRVRSN